MRLSTLVLLCAMASCRSVTASGPQVNEVTSPSASFSRYSAFSFGLADRPPAGYEISSRSLEVERRIRAHVLAFLEQRGYVEDNARADFVVKYASGTREVAGPGGGYLDVEGPSSVEESISIDVYDAATGTHVWHGDARAEIDRKKIDDNLLRLSVERVLADVPAHTAAASPATKAPAEMQAPPFRVPPARQ
jgi:hypothetical protein